MVGVKALANIKMKAFPGLRNYIPLHDKSMAQDHNTPHTAFELQEQSTFVRSSSPQSDDEPDQARTKKYAVVTSSELPRDVSPLNIGAGKLNTGYNPLFTRRWILLCFALLWVLIIVSLQIIYSVSQARNGLATTTLSLRYVWTYGPTAVLVVVTVLWRQVDYAAKYIQPWAALANGPLPAEQTLLLDYITDFQIVAFWQAIRRRHVTIASTILVFVLIKVLTVISTGLFSLEPTDFDGIPQQMRVTTVFDGSAGLPLDKIDSRAAVALYGHAQYKMLLPNGTSEHYAYQLFEPSNKPTGAVDAYNASVDVFMADDWTCETGTLTSEIAYQHDDGDFEHQNTPTASYFNTTIKLPGCDIYNGHLDSPSWYYAENDTTPRYGYWGTFQRVNCSNLDPSDGKFKRYIVGAAYSKGIGQNDNIMLNSSNSVCRPSYKIQPAYVTVFMNGSVTNEVVFHGTPRQLDDVTADDVALAVWSTLKQTDIPSQFETDNFTTDEFMSSMIRLTSDFEPEMLLNNTWLTEKSREVYQQNAPQVAAIYLLRSNDLGTTVQGTISQIQQRLWVRLVPTRLMQAGAIVMLILTIAMLFTIPQNVVPRPIESVAAIAVILARSPSLVKLLKDTGHLDLQELKRVLTGHQFMSTVADAPDGKVFSIRVITESGTAPQPAMQKSIKWSRPLVLHRVVMTLTMFLAVAVLVALEVLYRKAKANKGLADVDTDSLQRYVWLYTPTVVLVLLATTFNILDFELEFADPYHELARGYANASSSLLWDPLRNVTVQTCFHALRHARFALVASSISVILAPFLTIIVSGLFVALEVPDLQNTTATTQTWFNLSSSDDSSITEQATSFTLPALILQGNMSYPQWTYDELAFPSVDLSSKSLEIGNVTAGSLIAEIPAVRASMNCTRIPESSFYNFSYPGYDDISSISVNISTPDGCGNTAPEGQNSIYYQTSLNAPPSGSGFFGSLTTFTGVVTLMTSNDTILCPQWIAMYGQLENAQVKTYKAFYCDTGLESVQTNATITMDRQTITSIQSIDEASAKEFTPYWSASSATVAAPYFIPVNLTHPDEAFDVFVTAMVYGKDGIPRDELLPSPTDSNSDTAAANDPFIKQTIHTYRQWTAQWANIYMRNPISTLQANTSNIAGDSLPTSLPAQFSNPTRQRLFLNEPSTRILEGVIACLLICGITIFVLVDMSHVLPKKVGTIGAVASLLAGSELISEARGLVPRGMEWMSDGEIERRGLWSGEKFRMGWWDRDGDGSGGGNIDEYDGRRDRAGDIGEKKGVFGIDVVSRAVE